MAPLLYYAIPFFILAVLVEHRLLALHRRDSYERKDTLVSLSMGLGNLASSALMQVLVIALGTWLYQYRVFEIGQGAWAWLFLFFAEDLCYYCFHRSHHSVRLLWAAHVSHHSSQRFHLGTALRQSWTDPLTAFWFWLPLPLLGFHPLMVLTQQAVSLIYQFWIHTELIDRLGPLEWVLNTPSHHRVHHAANTRYLDKNLGGILIVWDRLFGTFEAEQKSEPVRYGIIKNIATFNPIRVSFDEWKSVLCDALHAPGLHNKLAYLILPAGWSHDGSSLTAAQLRAAERVTPEP
jgi:sterol desaturase/sphingolipid hydroxylase (fatty acid hydroxylase superfamily)